MSSTSNPCNNTLSLMHISTSLHCIYCFKYILLIITLILYYTTVDTDFYLYSLLYFILFLCIFLHWRGRRTRVKPESNSLLVCTILATKSVSEFLFKKKNRCYNKKSLGPTSFPAGEIILLLLDTVLGPISTSLMD